MNFDSNPNKSNLRLGEKKEKDKKEHLVLGNGCEAVGPGLVRTFLVFTELPIHIEYQVSSMPLLELGQIIDLDLSLRHPKNTKKVRKIQGSYIILNRKLKYESNGRPSRKGFSQYLEMKMFGLHT